MIVFEEVDGFILTEDPWGWTTIQHPICLGDSEQRPHMWTSGVCGKCGNPYPESLLLKQKVLDTLMHLNEPPRNLFSGFYNITFVQSIPHITMSDAFYYATFYISDF